MNENKDYEQRQVKKIRCGRCDGMSIEDEKDLREECAAKQAERDEWKAIASQMERANLANLKAFEKAEEERDVAVSAAAVQNKACAEEMLSRQHMQVGWDNMVVQVKQHYEAQLYAEAISRELRDFTMHQDNCQQLGVWSCTCRLSDLLGKL